MFRPITLKTDLRLVVARLKTVQRKKIAWSQNKRVEVKELLERGKEEFARAKVEAVIQEDFRVEVLEKLEVYCELLLGRFGLIEQFKECTPDIIEAVATLIWATPHVMEDIKELRKIRELFIYKYGKEFVKNIEDTEEDVDEKVLAKLKARKPEEQLVELYLEEIARHYKVNWESPMLRQQRSETELYEIDDELLLENEIESTLAPSDSESNDHRPVPPHDTLPSVSRDNNPSETDDNMLNLLKRIEALKKQ